MRIPTGGKILTVTASRRSVFGFTCAYCGEKALVPYEISQQAKGEYHVLNSRETKNRVNANTRSAASERLSEWDKQLFDSVNKQHDYQYVHNPVRCPHCKAKQPWSGFPKPWTRSEFVPWGLGMAFLGLLTIFTLRNFSEGKANGAGGLFGVAVIIGFIVVGLLPFLKVIKRNQARKECSGTQFIPPVYYNESNQNDLFAAAAVQESGL